MYLGFNPPNGTSKVFRFEDFSSTPTFKLLSEVNPNPTINLIPQNYRGKNGDSLSDTVALNGYPQLSSKVDVYNSWLAENSAIINIQAKQAETNAILDIYSNAASMFAGIGNTAISGASGATAETTGGQLGGVSGALGGTAGIINSAIGVKRAQANYDYYIKMLNAQKERQALLPDNVTLGRIQCNFAWIRFNGRQYFYYLYNKISICKAH